MTIFRDLSILWSLFHILILFMLLYRSRYPKKKTFLLTGIVMTPLILINLFGFILYGSGVMGKVFLLTCTLPSMLFFWIVSKDKKGRFFFTFCLADTVALWIIAVTNVLDYYLGGEKYILMFIGRLVLFPLLEWLAVRYLRKPYMELQKSVANGWGIFAGMTAVYYMLLAVMANFPKLITQRPQELPAFILILILMPLTYATIFSAMYRQLLLYRRQQNDRMWQEQKAQLESRLENQQRIRKLRHDMKTHVVTLSGLLNAGNTQEATAYLNRVRQETEALQGSFCANLYLNTVFSHYFQKMQELGTELRLDIQVGEETLPHMELCRIVSNGLENAYEALQKIPEVQREASVQIKYSREYLVIRIKNRCPDGFTVERGIFPKSDKEEAGHGFGLEIVCETAEKLGGEAWCYTENGSFILDVMVRVQHTISEAGG